jgi:hypothetical protein
MRGFFHIGLLLIAVSTASSQWAEDLRLLREENGSAIIEFTPRMVTMSDEGRLDFEGALSILVDAGLPLPSYRGVNITLPTARYRLQVLAAEHEDRPGLLPRYRPALRVEDDFGFIQAPAPRSGLSGHATNADLVELADLAPAGSRFSAVLRFFPIQYGDGGQPSRVYKRIVVRLDFDAWSGSIRDDAWRVELTRDRLSGMQVLSRTSAADSPLATGNWYKMDVGGTGIYKIDQSFFTAANIPLSSIGNIQSIRIFGNGGDALPEDLSAPRPDGLQEIPRQVVDVNGNGQFDAGDFILFYGKSPRGWRYNRPARTFNHYINHYTELNHYFLTFGGVAGKSMDSTASTNLAGAYIPEDFQGKFFVEEELFNEVESGRQWVGRSFDETTRSHTFTNMLHGHVGTKPTTYRVVLLSRSTTVDTFRVTENGVAIGNPIHTLPIDVNSIENNKQYVTPVITVNRTGELPQNRSVLRFAFGPGNIGAKGWVDWFEILYRRRFEAVNDSLLFTSPDTTALVEYRITNLSSRDVRVFDVTNHGNVQRVVNLTFSPVDASVVTFQLPQVEGSVREIAVVGPNGYKSPQNVRKIPNSNLYGYTEGADFIIIAPPEFMSAAQRLKAHRERPGPDYVKTYIADVERIFEEFSGGLLDPLAIRDYIRHARTNWVVKPNYVLLFGDGSYDYKDNLNRQTKSNWIPSYQSLNSIHQIDTYSSDDHFVMMEPGNLRPGLAIGRLPVNSVAQAELMVDKIVAYETTAPFGSWRNRITFVADDGLTSTSDEGSLHTGQSETLARTHTPNSFEKRKIFIIEYPTITSSTGRRKPDANRAIVDAINNGTLIINYTGHGNTKIWAHERIFGDEEDFPRLRNTDKLTLLVAATCDFARWDKAQDPSAGEKILVGLQAGAVAVVTSIRVVYSFENAEFNNLLFRNLLPRGADGLPPRIGDAMKAAKQVLFSLNDRKYHLLGDPTMRLAMPRALARFDSIGGRPATENISLPTLGRIPVLGEVMRPDSSRWSDFSGRALIEVFDSRRRVVIPEWSNFAFDVTGSLLYRGEVSVTNGRFSGIFPIPKDVSYDGNQARISVYTWSSSSDGIGYTESVRIQGTDTTAAADTTGPSVRVYLDSESYRHGDLVKPNALLVVDLFDESGINTSTAGIGHRLEAVLSSRQKPIDLTDFYQGNLDTYQSGQVRYPFTDLEEGRHSLVVRAWDIYNNSSTAETYFEVRNAGDGRIYNVFNFPNPFSGTTVFTFQRNSFEPIDVEVKVYTLAGRLVEQLHAYSVTDRFVKVSWNGRDRDGNELANGVYFYKVITRSIDRTTTEETLGKLSILR